MWPKTGQDASDFSLKKKYHFTCGFSGYGFAQKTNFAGERINFDDLTGLLHFVSNGSLELDTTVDEVFNKGSFSSGIAGNPMLPKLLVALPVFSW